MMKRKWWNRTNKFFTLVMVFKTACILVTVEMKMYIYVHMPSVSFFSSSSLLLRPVPVCSLLRLLLAML